MFGGRVWCALVIRVCAWLVDSTWCGCGVSMCVGMRVFPSLSVCLSVCLSICLSVCLSVSALSLSVYVCVCERERERASETESGGASQREKEEGA